MIIDTEYFERLVLAKDVYNDLVNNTESFMDFGFDTEIENLEVSANITYLLGAIMNNDTIDIAMDSATNRFFINLDNSLYNNILPFINWI